ncbi:MAG: hypothetical protein ACRDVF_17795 [Microbacterium sp.]|uniref:hypothetical protein n=1 Tax=Microbacterium sp. TaxID=51671 RepID=UPI003D6EE42C
MALEMIDENQRRVLPASDEGIARLLEDLGGWPFNVRWAAGGDSTVGVTVRFTALP